MSHLFSASDRLNGTKALAIRRLPFTLTLIVALLLVPHAASVAGDRVDV